MVNPSSRAASSGQISSRIAGTSAIFGVRRVIIPAGNAQVMPEESAGDQDIRVDGVRLLTWRQTAAVSELGRAPVVGPEAGPTSPEGPAVRAKRSRTNKPRSAETSPIALWYGDQRSGAGSVGAQAGGDQAASERAAVAAAAGG